MATVRLVWLCCAFQFSTLYKAIEWLNTACFMSDFGYFHSRTIMVIHTYVREYSRVLGTLWPPQAICAVRISINASFNRWVTCAFVQSSAKGAWPKLQFLECYMDKVTRDTMSIVTRDRSKQTESRMKFEMGQGRDLQAYGSSGRCTSRNAISRGKAELDVFSLH